MTILIGWILNALAIFGAAYLLPGVTVDSYVTALLISFVLGLINAVLRPILVILTLPITILTLGLFVFVINALLILLADYFIGGFAVASFWWALLFSLVLMALNALLQSFRK